MSMSSVPAINSPCFLGLFPIRFLYLIGLGECGSTLLRCQFSETFGPPGANNVIHLLEGIEENNQTHWRGRARRDHPLIKQRADELGDIDLAAYQTFLESLPAEDEEGNED